MTFRVFTLLFVGPCALPGGASVARGVVVCRRFGLAAGVSRPVWALCSVPVLACLRAAPPQRRRLAIPVPRLMAAQCPCAHARWSARVISLLAALVAVRLGQAWRLGVGGWFSAIGPGLLVRRAACPSCPALGSLPTLGLGLWWPAVSAALEAF